MSDLVAHWQRVYSSGGAHSWDQYEPAVTLRLLENAGVRRDTSVIDVGGGDGALTAALIRRGHRDLTVLDISEQGLAAGRRRVGPAAERVAWVVADVRSWRPRRTYGCWHDRALFHFLVDPGDRACYGGALWAGTAPGAVAVVGTFAADGPQMCSGLPVARYDAASLADTLRAVSGVDWQRQDEVSEEHHTPAGAMQPFTWVVLRRPGRGTEHRRLR